MGFRNTTRGVRPGTITAAEIADGAVTTPKLADDAVTQPKVAPEAIGVAEIVDNAITNPKIAPDAVNTAELADGAVGSLKLADLGVISAKIADLAVNSAKIANLAVGSGKLDNLAVTDAKIADLAVTSAKIANLAVDSAKINDLAVTNAKIANLAVDNAKIANLAVDNAKIANLAVDSAKIDNLAVTSAKIANLAVDSAKIAGELVGKTLTGGLTRTAATGPRVEMGDNPAAPSAVPEEIRRYDSDDAVDSPTGRDYVEAGGNWLFKLLGLGSRFVFQGSGFSVDTDDFYARGTGAFDGQLDANNGFATLPGSAPSVFGAQADFNDLVSMYAGLALERFPGATGCTVMQWDAGIHTDVTDANSRITIAHGLDQVPDVLLVGNWVGGGTRGQVDVFSRGTLNFQVECLTAAGVLTGAGVTRATYWLALDLA